MGYLNRRSPSSGALFRMPGWAFEFDLIVNRAMYHSASVGALSLHTMGESSRNGSS